MKKLFAVLIVATLFLAVSAMAQDQSTTTTDKKVQKAEKKEAKAAEKGKAMSLTGWVKSEGDKVTFVNDKDKQTWNVQNADMLKPHDGKHVKVKATLNEADKTMTVEKVSEMRKGKQAEEAKQ